MDEHRHDADHPEQVLENPMPGENGRRLDCPLARLHGPAFRHQALNSSGLKTRPERAFSSATAESRSSRSRGTLFVLADYIGPHKIMWALISALGRALPRGAANDP